MSEDDEITQAVEQLAARQHGVISRAQALSFGMTRVQVRSRVERGVWQRLAPGVLGFAGHRDSLRRRCWIAVLNAGDDAVLSHGTAGLLHGMWPLDAGPIEVTVPRGHTRALAGTTRHRPRVLEPRHLHQIDGLTVTTAARTILDLSAQVRDRRLAEIVEHCEVERICSLMTVGAELGRTRRRGLPGVRRLESVLDLLGGGEPVPHSELERLGDQVRRLAGLPEPLHEHPLPSARGRLGFVDRAWPEAMLIVEYDGRRWHTRRSQMNKDHQRDLEASALGWHPLRLTWEQLADDVAGTAELWGATYERRVELCRG
jgi:hypothetical protein